MKKITKVICEGREFTIYEDEKGFCAIAKGSKATIRRNSKEDCIQAVIDLVNVDKIVETTGMSRQDAALKYYFG